MSNYSQGMTYYYYFAVCFLSCSPLVPHFLFLVSLYFVDFCSDVFSFFLFFFYVSFIGILFVIIMRLI